MTPLRKERSLLESFVKRIPISCWLDLPSDVWPFDQTNSALTRMRRSLVVITRRKFSSNIGFTGQRINAPPRLILRVRPSTRPLLVVITTGHLTLTLRCLRFSREPNPLSKTASLVTGLWIICLTNPNSARESLIHLPLYL